MNRQHGAVALLLLVIIAVSTAASLLLHEFNNTRFQLDRDKVNAAVLAQAKDAVMGFALTNQDMPGGLPFPDRKESSAPNYDGNGDCVTWGFSNSHLLGKFPFLDEEGCGTVRAFDVKPIDASGELLWYAASQSLLRVGGNFHAGTNISELITNGKWLTVVNEQGNVLSSQVAFVLIAPGAVLAGQNRSSAAPDPLHFLDNFTVGGTTHNNLIADTDLSFIMARPVNDAGNRFNDRLLYVTRDEFINRLLWRIAGEIRLHLDQYHASAGHYPDGAISASDGECVPGTTAGFVPVKDADADCGGTLVALPSWWATHQWNAVTFYGHASTTPDQYTIQFSGCPGSVFTTNWNASLNRGEIQRSAPCW